MYVSRNERAGAGTILLTQIAPLPDDTEVKRLRELSMNYIREAERLERERITGGQRRNLRSLRCDSPRLFFSCSPKRSKELG